MRIAPRRDERPSDFAPGEPAGCPFCAGSEGITPPEIDRVADAAGAWLGRVVPNRYPAFEAPDGEHEVIIETPRHVSRFVDLTPHEAAAAVTLWARRLAQWSEASEYAYRLVFKNEGPSAGASLEHVHSQVVALREPPAGALTKPEKVVPVEVAAARRVKEANGFLVATAEAPRFAYETVIVPTDPSFPFEGFAQEQAEAERFAAMLQSVLKAIRTSSGFEAYNLMIQVPDARSAWCVEVTPRSSVIAGFELATGMWINATPPEAAAERLRRALAEL